MGKVKRHEKPHKKHSSYQPSKPTGQGIKRRQHSQDGALKKSAKAVQSSQNSNGKSKHPIKSKVPFSKFDRVLLVGEGDFSFALSLARHHEVGSIIATSYDDTTTLKDKYPSIDDTLAGLLGTKHTKPSNQEVESQEEWNGFSPRPDANEGIDISPLKSKNVITAHGIDATSLSKAHKKILNADAPFTKIVFNFPHTGGLSTDVNRQVRANQELLVGFFNTTKTLLATRARPANAVIPNEQDEAENETDEDEYDDEDPDDVEDEDPHPDQHKLLSSGQILVTIFEGEPYTLWNIRDLARHCGLQVIESFKFPWVAYPGYQHARTIGDVVTGKDRSDEGKRKGAWRGEERDARCYVLGLKEELTHPKEGKARKSGQDGAKRGDRSK